MRRRKAVICCKTRWIFDSFYIYYFIRIRFYCGLLRSKYGKERNIIVDSSKEIKVIKNICL